MQTFITDFDLEKNAQNLDNARLGKQRVEGLQIANCLLVQETRWKNHPAVKMWKGYEPYLLFKYLPAIIQEWTKYRGYRNEKCSVWINKLQCLVTHMNIVMPNWITKEFIIAHRSNLIRKKPDYYIKFWPDVPNNLEYIWPV